jgi:dienelactone hydrolase
VHPRNIRAALTALLLASNPLPSLQAAVPPQAEPSEEIEPFLVADAAGTLTLPAGAPDRRTPAVLILHDGPDPDGRAGRYADQLLGAGYAVLELLAFSNEGAAEVLAALAAHPRVAGQPVGVVGFGAGARLALSLPGPLAGRALLYPGCRMPPAEVPSLQGEAVLLMHGAQDPANPSASCLDLLNRLTDSGAATRWLAYRGAGYAWDRAAVGPEGPTLLVAPDGVGRLRSAPWPELVEVSASEVAGFFAWSFARVAR